VRTKKVGEHQTKDHASWKKVWEKMVGPKENEKEAIGGLIPFNYPKGKKPYRCRRLRKSEGECRRKKKHNLEVKTRGWNYKGMDARMKNVCTTRQTWTRR